MGKEKGKMKQMIKKYLKDNVDVYGSLDSERTELGEKRDSMALDIATNEQEEAVDDRLEPEDEEGYNSQKGMTDKFSKFQKESWEKIVSKDRTRTRLTVAEFKAILKEEQFGKETELAFAEKDLQGKLKFLFTYPLDFVSYYTIPAVEEEKMESAFMLLYPITTPIMILVFNDCKPKISILPSNPLSRVR